MKKEEDELRNDDTKYLFALLGGLFLPFVIVWFLPLVLSGRASTWKLRLLSKKTLIVGPLITLLLFSISIFVARSYNVELSLRLLIISLALFWLMLLPSCVPIFFYRLGQIANDLHNGRLNPGRTSAVRNAIFSRGILDAKRRFREFEFKLPDRSVNRLPVVGLVVDSPDLRSKFESFSKPEDLNLSSMNDEGLLVMPINENSPSHHLVIGATGSGKTTLLSRFAVSALSQGFRVIFLDFKGGKDESELFGSLDEHLRIPITKRFWPGDGMDLWRGDAEDVADRVIGFLPAPSPGGTEYHRARLVRAIKAAIERTSAGIPRSADELIKRIREIAAFADDEDDRAVLLRKTPGGGGIAANELADTLGSYLDPLRGKGKFATSGGWSWSDIWDLAVISLDSTREPMVRLGAAILHDFDSWIKSETREDDPRPIMLIVDEGGVLQTIHGAPALKNLVSRSRSSRVSIVIAAQTLSSLGEDGKEILATGTTRWLGRSPEPEQMSMPAGTHSVAETGHQDDESGFTGKRSIREQKAFLIDPDLARRLPNFVWIVSDSGKIITGYCPPLKFDKD